MFQQTAAATPFPDLRLPRFTGFAPNPGELDAFLYIPPGLAAGAPLVVVLHGCTQTAASFDRGSAWTARADTHGFAVLYPQQRAANNRSGCFNWFEPGDIARDKGEAQSIAAMVAAAVTAHAFDARRIYVTGLSAGGAMAAVLLATYPEVFAAGAIMAGLPYGVARDVGGALQAMAQPRPGTAAAVRAASRHAGPWPRLSVWHGDADRTVALGNGTALARQWADIHGLDQPVVEEQGGIPVLRWRGADGRVAVELWTVPGLGHGVAVNGARGRAAHFLPAGVDSTAHTAAFFGLTDAVERIPTPASPPRRTTPLRHRPLAAAGDLARTINDALRAAGLIRP